MDDRRRYIVYLRDVAGSIPDHHNKISQYTESHDFFWFPSIYKSYVYTVVC